MKLVRLQIDNFLSFSSNQVISFDSYGNLVLVKGEINDSENSNGAGKSSLFESVFWCLTGKTVRGVKAGEVVRNGEKECKVSVTFIYNSNEIQVVRLWSKSKKEVSVFIDGKVERFHESKQATIRIFEILGVSPEILSLVSFYGRNFTTFSSLTPRQRAEVIDIIAQGDKWEEARISSYSKFKDLEKEYQVLSSSIREIEEEISYYVCDLKNLNSSLKEEKDKVKQELNSLNICLQETRDKRSSFDYANISHKDEKSKVLVMSNEIVELRNDADTCASKIEEVSYKEVKQLDSEIEGTSKLRKELRRELQDLQVLLSQNKRSAETIKNKKGETTCIECGQDLPNPPDNESLEEEAKVFDSKISGIYDEIDSIELDLDDLNRLLTIDRDKQREVLSSVASKIKESNKVFQHKIDTIAKKSRDYIESIRKEKEEMQSLDNAISIIRSKIREQEENKNIIRIKASIETKTDILKSKKDKVSKKEKVLMEVDKESNLAKYWSQGFKDLRFSTFENTLTVLQEILNSFCSQQGLDSEYIEVTSRRESSAGKSIPEINIYVVRNGTKMNLDNLSEGETQRVDLACFFTFSILIEKSIGFAVGFSILDEPLSGLDYSGRQKVFDIITELSKDRKVFTIDHDANFQDLFSDVITISKNSGVSQIQMK